MFWHNLTMPTQTVKNRLKTKKIKLPQMIFFSLKTTNKIFMYLLTPFILQNFKNSSGQSRVIRMCHFRTQNSPSVMNKIFLVQTIIITFIHLLALCIVQNSKNSYSRSRVMRMCHFWGQNGPFVPSKSFFGKLLISFSSTH